MPGLCQWVTHLGQPSNRSGRLCLDGDGGCHGVLSVMETWIQQYKLPGHPWPAHVVAPLMHSPRLVILSIFIHTKTLKLS